MRHRVSSGPRKKLQGTVDRKKIIDKRDSREPEESIIRNRHNRETSDSRRFTVDRTVLADLQSQRNANRLSGALRGLVWRGSRPRVTLFPDAKLRGKDHTHVGRTFAVLASCHSMKPAPRLHLKTYLLLLVIVIFAPLGSVLLGKGMKGVGSAATWSVQGIQPVLFRILSNGYIWLGIASLLTFFVAYMLILSWADYSYVQPSTSLSYATVAILSHYVLGELISPLRWLGVLVICTGVFIVGRTSPRAHGAP